MTIIPKFKRKKQEGWEFKVIFDYTMSVRTIWIQKILLHPPEMRVCLCT